MSASVRSAVARRRAAAAERWRPDRIDLLLVVEAPPSASDRYFYFEDVAVQDSLLRHVVEAVLDASPEPFHDRREALPRCMPDLIARADDLAPSRIVLIGAPLYDLAYMPLRGAGLPVLNARLPYPGSGQQRRFLDGFRELVQSPAMQEIPR